MKTNKKNNGERGSSLVEFVIVIPVFMTMVMMIFQYAVYYNSALLVRTAAEQAVEAARIGSTGDWSGDATLAYNSAIARLAPSLESQGSLQVVPVDVGNDRVRIVASVRGAESKSLVPGLNFPINIQVSAEADNTTIDRST